jgi:hypothetical protein
MKRIIKWLKTKLRRWGTVADEPSNPEIIKPDINESTIDIFLGNEVANSMGDQKSGKDVPIPDIYADEHGDTVPHLEIPDQPSLDVGESAGVNPYDTAKMHKK